MKNKKYLSWFFSAKSMNKTLALDYFLIDKLCENFEKIYFINVNKFKLFSDVHAWKGEFSYEVNYKFKVPKNIEIFIPNTTKDFEDFISDKELIGINKLGRFFSDLKIHFLLAKYRIKQVQIHNAGFFNTGLKLKKSFLNNLNYKLQKNFSHKLIVLLSNLKLVPKIQIRFTSSSEIIEIINNSFIKKILYKLKLLYAKELVLVNSNSYDIFKKSMIEATEDKIVLLDANFYAGEYLVIEKEPDKVKIEKHYYYLNKLIKNLSNTYKKKIVVCIHPKDNLELKKKILS